MVVGVVAFALALMLIVGAPAVPQHPSSLMLSDLQELAALRSLNGSSTLPTRLSERVQTPLVSNDSVGSFLSLNAWTEKNGTTGGDWFQMGLAAAFNCGTHLAYAPGFEVWNRTASVLITRGPSCPTMAVAPGNVVSMTLNVSSLVCMNWLDLNSTADFSVCETQPDAGATAFGFGFDGGYFTGPMTETVTDAASACADIQGLPPVTYVVDGLTGFSPLTDEANCFSNAGSATTSSSSPQYFNGAPAPYSPHWTMVEWQNFTTDAPAPANESGLAAPTAAPTVDGLSVEEVALLAVIVMAAVALGVLAIVLSRHKRRR